MSSGATQLMETEVVVTNVMERFKGDDGGVPTYNNANIKLANTCSALTDGN